MNKAMPRKDLQELMEERDDAEEYVKQKAMELADTLLDGETPSSKALETYNQMDKELERGDA